MMETGTKTPVYENQQLSDGCRFEIQRSTMIGDESICPEVEAIEAPCANLLMTKKAAVTGEGYIFNNWLPSNYSSDPKKTFSRRILGYRWSYLRDAYSKSFRSLLRQNRFKNGVWVTNRFSNNYYHWLCKELPKVYLLEQSGFDYELFLPAEIARLEFARKSLEAIGVTEYQTVDFGSAALVEKLYTVDFFGNTKYPDPNVISALQETILRNFEPERSHDGPTRVFISRQSATKRRILNQSDVDDVLNRYGFHSCEMEKLSFEDQMRVMRNCEVLVAPHGAGLTNMLFMRQGGSVLEMRIRKNPMCFVALASSLNHEHYSMPYRSIANKGSAHWSDMEVDIDRLDQSIQMILDKESANKAQA